MPNWFRGGFYGGLALALLVGIFLTWLWRPERQVHRHQQNFVRAIEGKDWQRAGDFVDGTYHDQWRNDRTLVLDRTREVFRYLRNVRMVASNTWIQIDGPVAHLRSYIAIEGDGGELMAMIKERIDPLKTPFDFEWRRVSRKPWDWKLVRVSNAELSLPEANEF
jgi:hypothetical protein